MREAKLKDFMNPSADVMRTKPGLIEVSLRSASVVSKMSKCARNF